MPTASDPSSSSFRLLAELRMHGNRGGLRAHAFHKIAVTDHGIGLMSNQRGAGTVIPPASCASAILMLVPKLLL